MQAYDKVGQMEFSTVEMMTAAAQLALQIHRVV